MIRRGFPTNNEYPFATLAGLEPSVVSSRIWGSKRHGTKARAEEFTMKSASYPLDLALGRRGASRHPRGLEFSAGPRGEHSVSRGQRYTNCRHRHRQLHRRTVTQQGWGRCIFRDSLCGAAGGGTALDATPTSHGAHWRPGGGHPGAGLPTTGQHCAVASVRGLSVPERVLFPQVSRRTQSARCSCGSMVVPWSPALAQFTTPL